MPPHDLEAEEALLGAMLLSHDAIRAAVHVGVTGDAFYVPAHGTIFETIVRAHECTGHVDIVTVADELGPDLEAVGGRLRLHELQAGTPIAANAPTYAAIVARAADQRRVIDLAGHVAEAAYDDADAPVALLDKLHEGVGRRRVSGSTLDEADLTAAIDDPPQAVPRFLEREGDGALIYPGRAHDIHGEVGLGKTWLGLVTISQVLAAGGRALMVDYEDGPAAFVERLGALGVAPETIGDPARVRYVQPATGLAEPELAHLRRVLEELAPDIVVLDGFATALARDGVDENANSAVTAWASRALSAIRGSGAALLILDHVARHPEGRTRGARGAGAKLALLDGASYELRGVSPFSRDRAGAAKLVIAKDRPGCVGAIGETAAVVRFQPSEDRLEITLTPDTHEARERWRPTALMERLSRVLEERGPDGLNRDETLRLVPGRAAYKRTALAELVAGEFVDRRRQGREVRFRSVKPFRADDGPQSDDGPTRVPGPESDEDGPRSPAYTYAGTRDRSPTAVSGLVAAGGAR